MGKRTPSRPTYTANLVALIAEDVTVKAMCERCNASRIVDLAALVAVKGADYDLWCRRTRCRITEGCGGWCRFYFNGRGRFEPMRD